MKELIFSRYKTLSTLFISMCLSIFLLMVRMKLTLSFQFIFLVWNLFLAFVPFMVTLYLSSKQDLSKLQLALTFLAWLLFLPNAPYLITDLIHLQLSIGKLFWLDALVISSFAINGLLCYLNSIKDMKAILQEHVPKKWVTLGFHFVPFLAAYGVFLGRFLRYNSWDILHQPFRIALDSLLILVNPVTHYKIWLFTIVFGGFLYLINKLHLTSDKRNW